MAAEAAAGGAAGGAWLGPALIGSALIGGIGSAIAGSQAAKAQKKAASQANATQLSMFREANDLNEPWRMAGMGALNQRATAGARAGDWGALRSEVKEERRAQPDAGDMSAAGHPERTRPP